MEKNKLIILVIVVVVALLAVGIFAAKPNPAKEASKVEIKCNSIVKHGDSIKIALTDLNDTPISNQTVNVSISDNNNTTAYSLATNAEGLATFKIDKDEGNYTINCTYGGNDNYTANSTVKKIMVEKEEAAEVQSESSSSSESSADTSHYTYSAQRQGYVRDDGEWHSDSKGNDVYTYKGSDGVIYERYYDKNGKEINPNDYFR